MTQTIDKVAWIHIVNGKVLCARSKGKDLYYFPGGKREQGESDTETLIREVQEEMSVLIKVDTVKHFDNFQAAADGKEDGVLVKMSCYTAEYEGELKPAAEIAEMAWLSYSNRDQVSLVSQMIFDQLYALNKLN